MLDLIVIMFLNLFGFLSTIGLYEMFDFLKENPLPPPPQMDP